VTGTNKKDNVITLGPAHPLLIEPLQLKYYTKGDKVVNAELNIGYVHRGIEKAMEGRDFHQAVNLAERVCGICNASHALTYCVAAEGAIGIKPTDKADLIRVVLVELNRLHSHLLWLGAYVEAIGLAPLFVQSWKIREIILDATELISGSRVISSSIVVGGVRRNIDAELFKKVKGLLAKFEEEFRKIEPIFRNDSTIKKRSVGIGNLTKDIAIKTSAVGPVARGSGIEWDLRTTKQSGYRFFDYKPIVEDGCDCYARMLVRLDEVKPALEMVYEAMNMCQDYKDTLWIKPDKWPSAVGIGRVEAPRGELFYYAKGNGTNHLERVRIRTPTYANIPALLAMLPGCNAADVATILLTIDPCMACAERKMEV